MEIVCNVVRHSPLSGPVQWAEGDYTKIADDGTESPATYEEYCAYRGLPVMRNVKIVESPQK